MYIEKRQSEKNIKYYLVHSYRDDNKIKKIRKYLGQNLSEKEIQTAKKYAENEITKQIEILETKVFLFTITKKQVEQINKYNDKILISHLDPKDWEKFTEEFTYNTNAIEGSTVKRDEVPSILYKKRTDNPEEIETKGVANAIKFIKDNNSDISLDYIKQLHKICFLNSKSFAGKFRDVEVVIKDSSGNIIHTGFPTHKLDYALRDMILWYKENKKTFKPLVLAAIMHNQFEHIHPFQDGNGRVGRLLLNQILIKYKYPPINIFLEDRYEYYETLREYSENKDIKPTLKFLIKQYKKTLKKR